MRERRDIGRLIVDVSSAMVRSTPDSLGRDISSALSMTASIAGADFCSLIGVAPDGRPSGAVYCRGARGEAGIADSPDIACEFPWVWGRLVRDGENVVLVDMDCLPHEAAADREAFRRFGIASALHLPLFTGREIRFVFTLHSRTRRAWSQELVSHLCILGDIFGSALQRSDADMELRRATERLETAANSSGCALWELDMQSGVFWTNDTAREQHNFGPDETVTLQAVLERMHPDDRPAIHAALEKASRTGEDVAAEYRIVSPGGATRWMISRGRPHTQGGLKVLMGVTMEMTQRKMLEMELRSRIAEAETLRDRLEKENELLRLETTDVSQRGGVIGDSERMRGVLRQVRQVARTGSTVLIQGETGTGKGLIAQTIHNLSDRSARPMVTVNCAALPGALVESELFGREKGAYTGALSKQRGRFEMANGSTLFLDEISEISLETQAKLLRALQDGEFERLGSPQTIRVDVRVIAATNRNLEQEVAEGRFRRDLLYRLNIFPIDAPPLRELRDDIPQMVWEFVSEFGARMGKKIRRISSRDMETLQSYPWPGNVRELRNVIEHSLIVSRGETLELQRLAPRMPAPAEGSRSLEDMERQYILSVLRDTRGRIKGSGGAADLLRMKPSTLYSRMRKLGIAPASTSVRDDMPSHRRNISSPALQ